MGTKRFVTEQRLILFISESNEKLPFLSFFRQSPCSQIKTKRLPISKCCNTRGTNQMSSSRRHPNAPAAANKAKLLFLGKRFCEESPRLTIFGRD